MHIHVHNTQTCADIHMCTYIHKCIYIYTHLKAYTYICTGTHMCTHICTYMHRYTHTHTCTQTNETNISLKRFFLVFYVCSCCMSIIMKNPEVIWPTWEKVMTQDERRICRQMAALEYDHIRAMCEDRASTRSFITTWHARDFPGIIVTSCICDTLWDLHTFSV